MQRVRRATPADVGEIAAVHRLSRADYYGRPADESDDRETMWRHFLGEPGRVTYVVEQSGQIVAVMSVHRSVDPDAVVELTAIYVHPAHVGEGIGSVLHGVFDEQLMTEETAVLEVWAGNRRAIEFYERRGWTRTGTPRPGPQDTPFVTYRLDARRDG